MFKIHDIFEMCTYIIPNISDNVIPDKSTSLLEVMVRISFGEKKEVSQWD